MLVKRLSDPLEIGHADSIKSLFSRRHLGIRKLDLSHEILHPSSNTPTVQQMRHGMQTVDDLGQVFAVVAIDRLEVEDPREFNFLDERKEDVDILGVAEMTDWVVVDGCATS